MKKPTNPRDTIKQLNKAATRQNSQFLASMLIGVAILMKRQGMTRLDITPEELATLKPGEQLLPAISPNGGISFEFSQDLSGNDNLLGKLPTPEATKEIPAKKVRRK